MPLGYRADTEDQAPARRVVPCQSHLGVQVFHGGAAQSYTVMCGRTQFLFRVPALSTAEELSLAWVT